MDERFAKVLKDPRFKRISKKDRKVKIDSRFENMFTDERFHTKFSIDKRGKPISETEKEDLHKFYEIGSDDDNDDDKQNHAGNDDLGRKAQKISDTSSKHTFANEKKKTKNKKGGKEDAVTKKKNIKKKEADECNEKFKDKSLISLTSLPLNEISSSEESSNEQDSGINFDDIRGENLGKSEDSDSDNEDTEVNFEDLEEGIMHGWGELDEHVKRIDNAETCRLAICNCDWDKIGATDLYVLCNSFKPAGGIIKSVKIYPSDFGIERIKEEELTGPKELKDTILQSDDESEDENTEGSRFHMEKLREYQLNRLRYYYAIVDCDTRETANKIYEECDGMEYELSATRLDLRFVPNNTTFEHEPKSVATELPNIKNYEPASFFNTALQQSTVRLTWDETDTKRLESTMRKFTKDDLETMDFKDYLASSSDEDDGNAAHITNVESVKQNKEPSSNDSTLKKNASGSEDEDEDERIRKYRLLMQEIDAKEKGDEEQEGDMEVMWEPGMSSIGGKIIDAKGDKSKSTKTDNKNEKGKKSYTEDNLENENDIDETDYERLGGDNRDGQIDQGTLVSDNGDDAGFNDPFFHHNEDPSVKKGKKKKKKKNPKQISAENMTEEEKMNKKELELLLLDESEDKKHFNLKTIMEQEKLKSKKKRKKNSKEIEEDTFEIDVDDPRFNALYSSHLYALDPSEQHFKKTKATDAIIKEVQRRRGDGSNLTENLIENNKNDTSDKKKIDPSLSALVKSVKSKTQSHQLSRKRKKLK